MLEPSVDRAAFMARLRERGIQTSIHYPPIHQFTAFQGKAEGVSLPVTEAAGRQEVTLPLFPTETPEQVQEVITTTLSALHASEAWRAGHA
jgi:dTDP-4-amino-4,6-dideoxygalactose transaminase